MYLHKLEKDEKTTFLAFAKYLAKIDDAEIDDKEKYMLQYMANEMGLDLDEAETGSFNEQQLLNVFYRHEARRILILEGLGICASKGEINDDQKAFLFDLSKRLGLESDFVERAAAAVKKQWEVMDEFDSLIEKG